MIATLRRRVRHTSTCVLVLACLLALAACAGCSAPVAGGSSSATSGSSGSGGSGQTTKLVEGFRNPNLGNGMAVTGSMKLDYAQCFTVDYYDGGYKLLCLQDGARYLVVPEGKEAPRDLSSDIVVIQQPVTDVYLVASDTWCLLDALGATGCVTVSGIARDSWSIQSAVWALDSGAMVYGGKYNTPDYELLVGKHVKLAIESTMINHTPDVREKLIELGISVFTEMSSYEKQPLGRTEWVKCYGAMLNKESEAEALFNAQVAEVNSLDVANAGKVVAYFYINSNGAAVVRRPDDYVAKMIEQAGGTYAFSSLSESDGGGSSVTLEMEQFYSLAKNADIIIYNSSIDSSVNSVDDLTAKNPLLAEFKAVKNANVWATGQNMYQQMMQAGSMIADFNTIITGSGADVSFVRKLS